MRRISHLSLAALTGIGACIGPSQPVPSDLTHPTGEEVSTLVLTGRPHGVAVGSNGVFYISQIDANRVMRGVLTAATQAFSGHAMVGDAPAHVALGPQAAVAYTANQFGNSMSIVNTSTNLPAGDVPLSGSGFNLLVSPTGLRVWVTTADGMLHVIDVASKRVTGSVRVGSAANGLAYDPREATLYVSSIHEGSVTAIDVTTMAVKRVYPVGAMPQRLVLSPDGSELYIASEQRGLQVLTPSNGVVVSVNVVSPGSVGLAMSPDGAHLYLTNPPAGRVIVVDRSTRTVVRTHVNMGVPRNVAFDARGTTAIVTDELNRVHFIR